MNPVDAFLTIVIAVVFVPRHGRRLRLRPVQPTAKAASVTEIPRG